jgi:hypothetical protein
MVHVLGFGAFQPHTHGSRPVRRQLAARLAPAALMIAVGLAGCGTTVPLSSTGELQQSTGASTARQSDPAGAASSSGSQAVAGNAGAGLTPSHGGIGPGSPGGARTDQSGGPVRTLASGQARPKTISIGFIAADFAKLVATVGGNAAGDPHQANRALVKAMNARGGLAGRRIEAIYYTVDGSAADYSTQEQAACAAFTQDHHVEAVLGDGAVDDTLVACLLHAGVPIITSDPVKALDEAEWRRYPNLIAVLAMAEDRQAATFVEQSVRTGWLTKKNKLGVLNSGCPWGERSYNNVVVPAAKRYGVPVEHFSFGCYRTGAGALPPLSSDVQSAALQFRAEGVDRVMILGANADAAAYIFLTKYADSQRWYPGYIVGSGALARGWVESGVVSRDQAANTREVGWIPPVDVADAPQTPEVRACTALVVSGGAPAPTGPGAYGGACDMMLVLQKALARSGGIGGLPAIRSAVESFGTSYVGASNINGKTWVGPDRHDGAQLVAVAAYQAGCGCFRYIAKPQPVP